MALMSVAAVKSRILSGVTPLESEAVSIYEASGRVLAANLEAKITQPPFDASAMDGYAVRAEDAGIAPRRLRVIGEAAAGSGFSGRVGYGEAVRIFTGAPLPEGAGTVVIQENTKVESAGEVTILEGTPPGRNIRLRGFDFQDGDILLAAGSKLGAPQLMLAAAMNHDALPVRRKPLAAILANGDELVPPGTVPRPGQIVSSIPAGLKAAIEAWGGKALLAGIARDSKESLGACIDAASSADILVTIGGASVGDHDLVRATLEEKGARFEVLKAAMRPGKPVMFGFLGGQRIVSLPGNPASAFICALIFLKPLIAALLGLPTDEAYEHRPLAQPIDANGAREHYMRATLIGGAVAPIADQDSSLVRAFAMAQCLIVRPVNASAIPAGALVPTLPLQF
jgi:molybdopterin molybdotransferase